MCGLGLGAWAWGCSQLEMRSLEWDRLLGHWYVCAESGVHDVRAVSVRQGDGRWWRHRHYSASTVATRAAAFLRLRSRDQVRRAARAREHSNSVCTPARVTPASHAHAGMLIMAYGTASYFRVQRCIARGMFPQNKVGVLGVMTSTAGISLLALHKLADDRHLAEQFQLEPPDQEQTPNSPAARR